MTLHTIYQSNAMTTTNNNNKLKWIIHVNMRGKTLNLLDKTIGKYLHYIRQAKISYLIQKALAMKKVNKLDFIKIKNFNLPKGALGAGKASQTGRKYPQYIYLTCILHIDMFLNSFKSTRKKTGYPILKSRKKIEGHFTEENI